LRVLALFQAFSRQVFSRQLLLRPQKEVEASVARCLRTPPAGA